MAAMEVRHQLEEKMLTIPECYTTFRCAVIKEDVTLEMRQKIAGREQARAEYVKSTTLSERVAFYLARFQEATKGAVQRTEDVDVLRRPSLLKDTYMCTGCTIPHDGTMVCYHSPPSCVS